MGTERRVIIGETTRFEDVQVPDTTEELLADVGAVEVCADLREAERSVLAELLQGRVPEQGAEAGVSVQRVTVSSRTDEGDEDRRTGASMLIPLESAGITRERLALALHEGLKARKHVSVSGRVKRIPDYAIRIKYLELAHKLRGDFPKADNADISVSYEQRLTQVMARARGMLNK